MNTLFVALLSLNAFAGEPISPAPAMAAPSAPLVSCHFVSQDLDATEIYVTADGTLTAKTNPKYLGEDPGLSPFLAYPGLMVTQAAGKVRVVGDLLTMGGPVALDVTLPRGKTSPAMLEGQAALCTVL